MKKLLNLYKDIFKKSPLLTVLGTFLFIGFASAAFDSPANETKTPPQANIITPAPEIKKTVPLVFPIQKQAPLPMAPAVNTPVSIPRKSTSQCDPNYSGCVPIASDVDCAGGTGNGPAYVRGPVRVIGTDIYKLDKDRDGFGCE